MLNSCFSWLDTVSTLFLDEKVSMAQVWIKWEKVLQCSLQEELSDCVASEFAIKNALMQTLGSPLVVSGVLRFSLWCCGAFVLVVA
ncbi:hypothetical protein VNO80_10607 [Phaseolus coccineus]|uniref:Uncharacterized protein n=1 Tax=Phaseolus coccineus TaxID=3886 RepID=A0AAN9N8G7_PHACN